MDKKSLEMFKMNKAQMNKVNGGINTSTCRRHQEMANEDESKNWTNEQWDNWSELWHLNCESREEQIIL